MLFNSYSFIFLFFPLTYFLCLIAKKLNHKLALSILFLASFIFYSTNQVYFAGILLISIIINFYIASSIIKINSATVKKLYLIIGIIFNLAMLCYFKYLGFFVDNINTLFIHRFYIADILLPIGISFFTFTQIAFLVDSYQGLVKKVNLLNYGLFVTYFPHLIAGPIIHHQEVMPQFEKRNLFSFESRKMLLGLSLFAIGLFKKVVLADQLARYVVPIFDLSNYAISTFDAWIGALAYSFELYFDFSGYSDMALGTSFLFGIKLPVNFYSPYQAMNIIEFWRRWNMTLSRFLRHYLYIPLGGNRHGQLRKYANLIITMLLGGLWHGANWTFVFWGLLHAIYLCINHAWIFSKQQFRILSKENYLITQLAKLMTFMAVMIAWVFFRSPNFTKASEILRAMFIASSSVTSWYLPHALQFFSIYKLVGMLLLSGFVCWFLPNPYQIFSRFRIELPNLVAQQPVWRLNWKPTLIWNSITAVCLVIGICFIQTSSTFLYFQF